MKIRKYIGGGISYIPTSGSGRAASGTTKAAPSESEGFLEKIQKKMIDLASFEGLDSDVSVAITRAQEYLSDPTLLSNPSAMNAAYLDIVRWSNLCNKGYKDLEDAKNSIEKEDAWAEPAHSTNGELWVTDGTKVFTVKPKDFDSGTMQPLNNADLYNLRKNSPKMAFKSNIASDLSSAVGMDTIVKWVSTRIKDFQKTTYEGYASKKDQQIASGMEHIVSGDKGDFAGVITKGPDGVYKISESATVADTGLSEALSYLYGAMPKEYKYALATKAAVEGFDPNTMLLSMLIANTERKITATYDRQASGDAGLGAAGKEAELKDTDTFDMRVLTSNDGFTMVPINLNPNKPNETRTLFVESAVIGQMREISGTTTGEGIKQGALPEVLRSLAGIKGIRTDNVTFGDHVLSPGEAGAIMWDGSSMLKRTWLPYKTSNGTITPDWDLLAALNEFDDRIKNQSNMSEIEKQQLMISLGINPNKLEKVKDGTYRIKQDAMHLFIEFDAIASSKNLDIKKSRLLDKLDEDTADHFRKQYENSVKYGTVSHAKSARKISDFSGKGDLYIGAVYMPVGSVTMAATQSRNQNVSKEYNTNWAAREAATQQIVAMKNKDLSQVGQF